MKQFNKNKRTLYLLGMGSVVLVAALLCMLLFFYRSYQTSLARESKNHLLEVSSQTAGSLENILAGNRQLLQTVETAFLSEYQYLDGEIIPLLGQMRVLGKTLGDSGGFFLLNEGCLAYMPDGTQRSFALVEDIRELTEKGEDFTFLSVEADGGGRLYIVSPIEENVSMEGEQILGLGAYFDISNISFLLNQKLFGESVSCYLLDDSGALIYQSNAAKGSSSMQPFYYIQQFGSFEDTTYDEIFDKMMVQHEDGVASYTLDGQEYYITYNNLSTAPWVLAVSYEKEVVNSSMNSFSNSVLLVCVVVFTCIVLILLVMSFLTYRNAKFAYQRALSEQERHLSELAEQVYDNQISVDLETMQFKHYRFREESYLPLTDSGDYAVVMQVFTQLLLPSDCMLFEELFAPALLREHADSEEKNRPQSVVVCLKEEGRWIQLTRYLHREQGRFFATIMSTDITEEMELKKQLNQKNVELAQANEAKSMFLANMSHDIRTPMNAIVGMTRIASANVNDPERTRDCLEKIELSSHHLLSLINDVLDMSKIESGKLEVNQVEFDLSEQIASITSIIAAQAKDRSQEFNVYTHNIRHEKLIGDSLRFSQVLINILGNSVKFTPVGGRITLEVTELPGESPDKTQFVIRTTDTGIGMSKEFLPHLFDAFTQETDGKRTQAKGTGLGMTICSNLVKLMGGTIAVESELEKGTCFTVELPFYLPELSVECERLPESTKDLETRSLSGRRFLLVDDNELNREIARELLIMHGADVDEAFDGTQALEAFNTHPLNYYDVILMDLQMPVMNGYEATGAIRALDRPDAASTLILAVTADAFSEDIKRTRQAGMNAHITKPIDFDQLEMLLAKLFKEE